MIWHFITVTYFPLNTCVTLTFTVCCISISLFQTENVQKNAPLAGDDSRIRAMWNWLGYVQSISPPEEPVVTARSPRLSHGGSTPTTPQPAKTTPRFPGVNGILKVGNCEAA